MADGKSQSGGYWMGLVEPDLKPGSLISPGGHWPDTFRGAALRTWAQLLFHQHPKPRLFEVMVVGEGVGNAPFGHNGKRNTVGERPFFVRARWKQLETPGKPLGGSKVALLRNQNLMEPIPTDE